MFNACASKQKNGGDVILEQVHERVAKWSRNRWLTSDQLSYQWKGKSMQSPLFRELNDALAWIKSYDEEKANATTK